MKRFEKLICFIIVMVITSYGIYKGFSQYKLYRRYSEEQQNVETKLEEKKNTQQELLQQKENINSDEVIEKKARERMDMYKPTDIIFVEQ